jgi:hypothetical protein
MQNSVPNNHNEIASLAYQLWEQHGRPHGRDQEFWLQAEAQLLTGKPSSAATTAKRDTARATPAKAVTTQSNSSRPQPKETVVLKSLDSIPQSGNSRQPVSRG